MDLCQRRWLQALHHINLPINGKRNLPRQKVKLIPLLKLWQIWQHMNCLVLICSDYVVCLSFEPGALQPVTTHQHVVMQHSRQTVSYSAVHKLGPVK